MMAWWSSDPSRDPSPFSSRGSASNVPTIKAWLRGMNLLLDDKSPALTLRKTPEAVRSAPCAFIYSPDD